MQKGLLLLVLFFATPVFGAHRVRCAWLVGVVQYFNTFSGMREIQTEIIEGMPDNNDELTQLLAAALGPEVPVLQLRTSVRTISPDERIDRTIGALASIKQQRIRGFAAHESERPTRFLVDPTRPKEGDDELVNWRLGIAEKRMRKALEEILRADRPSTLLAPPLVLKAESVLPAIQCLIHDPTIGVAAFEYAPRLRMRSGALKLTLSWAMMTPFVYLGSTQAIPLRTALVGTAAGSTPGFVGLWEGMTATYSQVRNALASDKLDVHPFEFFAVRAHLGKAQAGHTAWLYAKDKSGWELDMVISIGIDEKPVFLTMITKPSDF